MRARITRKSPRGNYSEKKKIVSNVSRRDAAANIKTQTHATKCANQISRKKCNVWTWTGQEVG